MSITPGHIVFAVVFAIVFILVIIWMYRKDLKLHKRYYRGSWVVLLTVLAGLVIFLLLKGWLIRY